MAPPPITIPSRSISSRGPLATLSPSVGKATIYSCSPRPSTSYYTAKTPFDQPSADLEGSTQGSDGTVFVVSESPQPTVELKQLARLSIPIAVTYMLEILPVVVSIMLVGKIHSHHATAYVGGATLSSMVISLTGEVVGSGLATALDTLCSQAHGAGKPEKIGVSFQTGLLVLAAAYIPAFWINWYTYDVLILIQQPVELALLASRFSRIIVTGLPFMYLYELLKKVLQAQHVVAPMLVISGLTNVVNIGFGVYFTLHTSLGFEGAALARVLANATMPLAIMVYFLCKPMYLRMWWPGWQPRAALQHVRVFLELGIPGMFMIVLENLSYNIVAVLVAYLPNSVVAIDVHSVLWNVVNIAFRMYLGLAIATNVVVGNHIGSGRSEHAKMASQLGIVVALALSVVVVIVIVSSRTVLPRLFVSDEHAIAMASAALLYLIPFELLDAVNCVMQGIFRGIGCQSFAAVVNLVSLFLVGLPCRYVLAFPLHLGVEGMWHGLTSGYVCCVAVSLFKIWRTHWSAMVKLAQQRIQ